MCVIIYKPKNVIITDDLIQNACAKNEDGFGFAIVENGRLKIVKEYREEGTDAEKVLAVMREHDDKDMMVHLRIKTIGDKNLENCHPFMVMSKDEGDPWDIYFSHNGTLSEYGKDDVSDSRMLAEEYWRPLFKMFVKAEPEKNPLKNELIQHIIEKMCGSGSRFCFLDNEGHAYIANIEGGKMFGEGEEKWWASNAYSFEKPYVYQRPDYNTYGWREPLGESGGNFIQEDWDQRNKDTTTTSSSWHGSRKKKKDTSNHHIGVDVPELPESWWCTDELFDELTEIKKYFRPTGDTEMSASLKSVLASDRKSYTELTNVAIDELRSVEWDDLLHHCSEFPELTAMLILQLLKERDNVATVQSSQSHGTADAIADKKVA